MNSKSVYIVAVSGGIDSVVLLHKLASRYSADYPKAPRYVVAHFNHGIRPDSFKDAEFVQQLANEYKLKFESTEGNLGPDASEATARDARYGFLREVKEKYDAGRIITAHHQDDVLETMVLNMMRGTGPRGLSPMNSLNDILRPLINRTKQELIQYAKEHKLQWREDSTNADEKYLRNYVRINVMPKLVSEKEKLLLINRNIEKLYHDIDMRIGTILPKQNVLSRVWFVGLPYKIQKEIIRAWLLRSGVNTIDSPLLNRVVIAIKTLPLGKKIDVNGQLWLVSEKKNVLITSK
jgi:tRNA(Ile)-lysidine synthetase-like protein